jgi:hypothetical protein
MGLLRFGACPGCERTFSHYLLFEVERISLCCVHCRHRR